MLGECPGDARTTCGLVNEKLTFEPDGLPLPCTDVVRAFASFANIFQVHGAFVDECTFPGVSRIIHKL